jgi:ribonucleoside-diphosphate reductase alpha chain
MTFSHCPQDPSDETGDPQTPTRRILPAEPKSITHGFNIAGHEGFLHVDLYNDGRPGQIFIRMAKEGSLIAGLLDGFSTAVTIALQHDIPLVVLCERYIGTRFDPSGFTGNTEIPRATSIADYVFRWLKLKFVKQSEPQQE